MVVGLDRFRAHFRDYADSFLLIGGAACDLALSAAGVAFRATKDIDIVLCIESLNAAFVSAFWRFVREGGYRTQETSTGRKRFYRFQKPADERLPFMLELFSRLPDALETGGAGGHLTPIPMEDEISSLSAILMDGAYYEFIRSGRSERDGLPLVGPEHLIPLKARAWLDLVGRKVAGEQIDSRSIRKHKNDVFRLYQIVDPDVEVVMPETIRRDMRDFVARVAPARINLAPLGVAGITYDELLAALREFYQLD